MKLELTLKGEIKEKDFDAIKKQIEAVKNLFIWNKLSLSYEELCQEGEKKK